MILKTKAYSVLPWIVGLTLVKPALTYAETDALNAQVLNQALVGTYAFDWGYSAPLGPNLWGTLAGSGACTTGIQQSPIAIDTPSSPGLSNVKNVTDPLHLTEDWNPSQLKVLNNGHTIEALYDSGNKTVYNGKTYTLQQFHFHTPSEHIINERQFPLEAHFVSATADAPPQLLVISVLFKVGRKNSLIQKILDAAPTQVATDPLTIPNEKVDARELINYWSHHFTYQGSLTTPPCSEGVQWIIQQEHLEASREQIQQFQTLLKGSNNRPIQSVNGREIDRYQGL